MRLQSAILERRNSEFVDNSCKPADSQPNSMSDTSGRAIKLIVHLPETDGESQSELELTEADHTVT